MNAAPVPSVPIPASPAPFPFDAASAALIIIDMQRDFLEPGGFGESLGNDVSLLRQTIAPLRAVLAAARESGKPVIHTREGHLPDLSDCPPSKFRRGEPSRRIGDPGPMGRILIRGEYGHGIIDELAPLPGEPVVDKPGKGAFHATGFGEILAELGVTQLVVTGVTAEVCVHTTVREANDRGFDCLVLSDCVGSYFPEFQAAALAMISAQGGIFGWTATSADYLAALGGAPPAAAPDASATSGMPAVPAVETPAAVAAPDAEPEAVAVETVAVEAVAAETAAAETATTTVPVARRASTLRRRNPLRQIW